MHPVGDEQAALLCTPGELLQASGTCFFRVETLLEISSLWSSKEFTLEFPTTPFGSSSHFVVVNEHIRGLAIDRRALCTLGKLSTTELYPQHTKKCFFFKKKKSNFLVLLDLIMNTATWK